MHIQIYLISVSAKQQPGLPYQVSNEVCEYLKWSFLYSQINLMVDKFVYLQVKAHI